MQVDNKWISQYKVHLDGADKFRYFFVIHYNNIMSKHSALYSKPKVRTKDFYCKPCQNAAPSISNLRFVQRTFIENHAKLHFLTKMQFNQSWISMVKHGSRLEYNYCHLFAFFYLL